MKVHWIKAKKIFLDEAASKVNNIVKKFNETIKFSSEVMWGLDLRILHKTIRGDFYQGSNN